MNINYKLHPNKQDNNFLRLTLKCNSNCYFCNTDKNTPNIIYNLKDVCQIIDDIRNDFSRIVISGGEPTLLGVKLIKIIKYIRAKGFNEIVLQTNGILLSNENFVKKIKESGVNEIFLSLHGHNNIIDKKISQVDFWDQKIKAVKNIINNKINLELNFVINKFNYKYLKDFIEFYHHNFYPGARLCISFVSPTGKMKNKIDLYPKYSQVLPYLKKIFKYIEENDLQNIQIMTNACGIPKCILRNYLNYLKIEKVNYINKNDRMKLDICKNCQLDKYCDGIWKEYVKKYGNLEFKPITVKL